MDYTERPLTPALSPPAATARQRGESEGERENPQQLTGVAHATDCSVSCRIAAVDDQDPITITRTTRRTI